MIFIHRDVRTALSVSANIAICSDCSNAKVWFSEKTVCDGLLSIAFSRQQKTYYYSKISCGVWTFCGEIMLFILSYLGGATNASHLDSKLRWDFQNEKKNTHSSLSLRMPRTKSDETDRKMVWWSKRQRQCHQGPRAELQMVACKCAFNGI